ncbi:MAG: hypothetical protein Q8O41_00535 [Candidatus Methanoperedens sp.]|nr:hypothetical protein [Candidatus Methanoperedens sp.]
MFDDPKGNNVDFRFGKEVKSNFSDLVMLEVTKITSGITGTSVMRLNLISPCKTDMTVKAYDAASEKCKCKNYYEQDKIWFKLQKNVCKVDTTGDFVVYALPDGTCPASVKGKKLAADAEQEFEVNATNEFSDPNANNAIYSCPITNKNNLHEDLDFCGRNKTYDKNCLISRGKISASISDSDYRKWLLSASRKDLSECIASPALRECGCANSSGCGNVVNNIIYDGKRVGQKYKIPATDTTTTPTKGKACDGTLMLHDEVNYNYFPALLTYNQTKYSGSADAKQNLDTIVQPLNLKPNVLDNDKLTPVAVCEESWLPDIIVNPKKMSCLTVSIDVNSMESYSKNGFGRNFCAEKKDSAEDWIESGCTWGTIPVSIAIGGLSMGLATPVVLYVVGMGGTLCSKLASDASKWPNNQY